MGATAMVMLASFPASLILPAAVHEFIYPFDPSVLGSEAAAQAAISLVAIVCGYLQWFVLVPKTISVIRTGVRRLLAHKHCGGPHQDPSRAAGNLWPNRICIGASSVAIPVFITGIAFGFLDRDVASGAVIGVCGAAPIIGIALVASNWTGRRTRLLVLSAWIALTIVLLLSSLSMPRIDSPGAYRDFSLGADLLALPISLLAAPAAHLLEMPPSSTLVVAHWVMAVAFGALQWLFLLPMLVRASGHGARQ